MARPFAGCSDRELAAELRRALEEARAADEAYASCERKRIAYWRNRRRSKWQRYYRILKVLKERGAIQPCRASTISRNPVPARPAGP